LCFYRFIFYITQKSRFSYNFVDNFAVLLITFFFETRRGVLHTPPIAICHISPARGVCNTPLHRIPTGFALSSFRKRSIASRFLATLRFARNDGVRVWEKSKKERRQSRLSFLLPPLLKPLVIPNAVRDLLAIDRSVFSTKLLSVNFDQFIFDKISYNRITRNYLDFYYITITI